MKKNYGARSFLYLAGMSLAFLLIFKFNWNRDFTRWFGFLGLPLLAYSTLSLTGTLVMAVFPGFRPSYLLSHQSYLAYRKTNRQAGISSWCYLLMITIFLTGLIWFYTRATSWYEAYQFKNYGRTQRVFINKTRKMGKAQTEYALFDFQFKRSKISSHLQNSNGLVAGDSATIVFSTENTDVIAWSSDVPAR